MSAISVTLDNYYRAESLNQATSQLSIILNVNGLLQSTLAFTQQALPGIF